VEDSALMARQLSNILNSAPDLTVVGRARDGMEALAMVEEVKPDKGKIKVLISIFGRPTPVELDFVQVAKL